MSSKSNRFVVEMSSESQQSCCRNEQQVVEMSKNLQQICCKIEQQVATDFVVEMSCKFATAVEMTGKL